MVHYYIGLDLGQAQDYTALALLEEALWLGDQVDWDSWGVYWPEDVPRTGDWVSPSALSPHSALRALYVNYHLGRPPTHHCTCATWSATNSAPSTQRLLRA